MGPKGGRFDPGGSRHAGELRRPARSEAHEGVGARLGCWTSKGSKPKEQGAGASSARPKARKQAREGQGAAARPARRLGAAARVQNGQLRRG